MITTLTPLSLNQGKLYARTPDAERVLDHLMLDLGFRATSAEGAHTPALRPTLRAKLAELASWAIPFGRVAASGR